MKFNVRLSSNSPPCWPFCGGALVFFQWADRMWLWLGAVALPVAKLSTHCRTPGNLPTRPQATLIALNILCRRDGRRIRV